MPAFRYIALTASGDRISGEVEAGTPAEAAQALQRSGHFPLSTKLSAETLFGRLAALLHRRAPGGPALSVATHELAALIGAGMPLDRALEVVASITGDKRLRVAFSRIRELVRGGSGLAAAIEAQPAVFPPLYVSLVQAGEAAGNLDAALAGLAQYLERSRATAEQVRSALVYPVILLATAGLTLSFVLTRVLPQFRPLFAESGKALPLSTRIVMGVGDFASDWGWVVVVLGIAAWLALRKALADPAFRLRWDTVLLKLPILGAVVAEAEAGRFSRTLGTLLKSGMTLPASLALARETVGNKAMAAAVADAAKHLRAGESLGSLLDRSGLFPDLAAQLVRVGEATGRLDDMLLHQAGVFERSVARSLERWLAALVPGLTIVLGILVAGIVGSVMAAILQMNELAG